MLVNRRHFLKIMASASALLVGCSPHYEGKILKDAEGDFEAWLTPWIRISASNAITLVIDKSEMGQGIETGLAMLIAEELEVGLDQVQTEFAPVHPDYKNPMFHSQATGSSSSTATSWDRLRKAAAMTREAFIAAGADHFHVHPADCMAQAGRILHRGSNRSVPYGKLLMAASQHLAQVGDVQLKQPSAWNVLGKPTRRLDTMKKVMGKPIFGMDVDVDGLLIAVVVRSPVMGGKLDGYSDNLARNITGVQAIFPISAGVAVVANRYDVAAKAASLVETHWSHGVGGSSDKLESDYLALLQATDSPEEGVASGGLMAIYTVPYLAHATMEPMNATAHVSKGRCEIWAPTQSQAAALATAQRITGFDAADIVLHTTYLGGGFGRRYYQDFVRDAVEISKVMEKPVKVVYSRSDDIKNDFYRPMSVHRMQARLKSDGMVDGWSHAIAAPSLLQAGLSDIMGPSMPGFIPPAIKNWLMHGAGLALNVFDDPTSVQGAADLAYAVGQKKISYKKTESPLPIGFWRSVGHSANGFAVEGFMDELAEMAGTDPLEFRLRHLKNNRRLLDLAQLVADRSKWGAATGEEVARGFAIHPYHGTWVAQVVEVSIEPKLKVHRVFAAIDCGLAVNPAQVEAQVKSGIVYGLSAALYGKIQFESGQVRQSNFHDYPVLRYAEMPDIEVTMLPGGLAPLGVGEASTPSVAPAVANALYRLTGKRARKLPLVDFLDGI